MQLSTYIDKEEEKRLRIEGFHCGPGKKEQEKMKKRMEKRAEELRKEGERVIGNALLRRIKR